jgi:hypothetical protein
MFFIFENRKSFFKFEHLILKLTNQTGTLLGPRQDFTRQPLGSSQDPIGTRLRSNWETVETWSRHHRDLVMTPLGFNRDLVEIVSGHHRDPIRTPPRPDQDTTETRLSHCRD